MKFTLYFLKFLLKSRNVGFMQNLILILQLYLEILNINLEIETCKKIYLF